MRALVSLLIVLAALGPAHAVGPESFPAPKLKLSPGIGWRLTAVIRLDLEDHARVLHIEGDVINSSQSERPSPIIRFRVLESDGAEIYHWTVPTNEARIKPGDFAVFEARLEEPPAEGVTVEIQTIENE